MAASSLFADYLLCISFVPGENIGPLNSFIINTLSIEAVMRGYGMSIHHGVCHSC